MNIMQFSRILVLALFPMVASATIQKPEKLEYEGRYYEFRFDDTPRILDDYFEWQGIPKPKELNHKGASLWRGYIGFWRVAEGRLWLTALFPDIFIEDPIPLGSIFRNSGPAVPADWFTGRIDFRRTETKREKKPVAGFKDQYVEVVHWQVEYLVIEKGRILRIETKEEIR